MYFNNQDLINVLAKGGVVVMPTDTLYGIVGLAKEAKTVERIYQARQRNPEKPCIVLIGNIAQLADFSIVLSTEQKEELDKYWPGPVSVVLDCMDETLSYLHRGTNTLAFRLPGYQDLRELLLQTGPLIAPSANIEGMAPAVNIQEAREYFGDSVDMYIDGGEISGKASKVIKLNKNGSVVVLRE